MQGAKIPGERAQSLLEGLQQKEAAQAQPMATTLCGGRQVFGQ